MKSDQQSEILRRLHCAAGHLNAVIEMTETQQPCEQVLHQLHAVQAALHIAGVKMIQCQAQSSQDVILNSSSVSQRADELERLQSLYVIFLKYSIHRNEVNYE
jgi:DNA-binding FrmR family transcriptional regulator